MGITSQTGYGKISLSAPLRERAQMLALAGDEVRIRILCFLFTYSEACVSDIAESIGASINTTSHHLRLMKTGGLLTSIRRGTTICYTIVSHPLMRDLEKIVCAP